jgi:hypothetical protein
MKKAVIYESLVYFAVVCETASACSFGAQPEKSWPHCGWSNTTLNPFCKEKIEDSPQCCMLPLAKLVNMH